MHRHDGPGQPAVIPVFLQLRYHRLGRVALVFADQRIQQRHQAITDQNWQGQRNLQATGSVCRHAGKGQQGKGDRQQPPHAFAVAVFNRAQVCVDRSVDFAHASFIAEPATDFNPQVARVFTPPAAGCGVACLSRQRRRWPRPVPAAARRVLLRRWAGVCWAGCGFQPPAPLGA